jgi:hypothetical protein
MESHRMNQQQDVIENVVADLLAAFDVSAPPVPVEIMLQRPKAGMWKEINLSELSTTFINIKQRYSPRMSVARLLARNICRSDWGASRQAEPIGASDEALRAFARAILMPRAMIENLSATSRTPITISMRFEVPEEDARVRLEELGYLVSE